MPNLIRLENTTPAIIPKKKVAAYARVSKESERMHHSLSAQVSYYSSLIQHNPEWQYAGVFADYGISGTGTAKREEFRRMLKAADNGEIDIILTKSIQRFARNTVDLLNTVRHLKDIGVAVWFEKEHIDSMSGDGELMLTILASFAQEESRSISENTKWAIQKRFRKGLPSQHFSILGYRWEGDELIIVPEEAVIVQRIYRSYLDGKSKLDIVHELTASGAATKHGRKWTESSIRVILTNVTYTGNLLLQKLFRADPISKRYKRNKGELPQYYVENSHPAIIDRATFDAVQAEMARRNALGPVAYKSLNTCCFTGKLKCPACGKGYRHSANRNTGQNIWICMTTKKKGSRCAIGGVINHASLVKACNAVLGLENFDENVFLKKVDFINVPRRNILEFHLKDGGVVTRDCPNTGRRYRWTPEARARAAEKQKEVEARKRKAREEACNKEE